MTSPNLVVYLTCLLLGKMAQATNQNSESNFVSANVGESLTLQCFFGHDDPTRIFWYKQSLGEKPRLISTLYAFSRNGTFFDEFKNNPRFALDTETGNNHLKISDLRTSDSATYYCAKRTITIEFLVGTLVSVKGSGLDVPALVHQSESDTVQPGGSVTLNCTVHTGTCEGEHSVYWFKNSQKSYPGLIYTNGGRNDQCKRNTQTQTCVYDLPMKTLNLSHAGTYYCAVASCGHILFGNGTKLDFKDEVDSFGLVYFLSGALTFMSILVALLAFLLYKLTKRTRCQCSESEARNPSPSAANAEGYQDAESLHYAALSVNLPNRSRRQRDNSNHECVYSSVKQ
ncbi:uncharacterized protein LOC131989424 isoform X2 [Centropristis striata]|uniref:uncharacterized protein LOC131989424 isoform X2 n=1 Tax=Centropristis striata TaxID=184440 RepID=UPI0027E0284B|nr:uncharacterized protein LOC131989424 isoform X2 [Centropristis striata]